MKNKSLVPLRLETKDFLNSSLRSVISKTKSKRNKLERSARKKWRTELKVLKKRRKKSK